MSHRLLAGLSAACLSGVVHAAIVYQVTDLGTLEDGATSEGYRVNRQSTTSEGYGINRAGDVVGMARVAGNQRAFVYRGGVMTDLGSLGGGSAIANAINRQGAVVGWALTAAGQSHAFIDRGDGMKDLGTLGGAYSNAQAVNGSGHVVGESTRSDGAMRAFVHRAGTMSDLGTLGGDRSAAFGINHDGWIVGFSETTPGSDVVRAFLSVEGVMTDLGTLGGAQSVAYAINAAGEATGSAYTADGRDHPFLYSNGVMQDLGKLPNYDVCFGIALNDKAEVVGFCARDGTTWIHPFVYRHGAMHELNRHLDPVSGAGWVLRDARGINNSGQITGAGRLNGLRRAYLLTPMRP